MISKRTSKLHQIENKLSQLWTNREERSRYLESAVSSACASSAVACAAEQSAAVHDFVAQIDVAGVKLYSSLIDIGRMDLMSSIYPVMEELLGKQFKTLVLDYFETMPPVHYNLNQSASRFPQYVQGLEKLMGRYPFLAELADYEWIELAVLEDPTADNQYQYRKSGMDVDPSKFAGLTPVLNSVFIGRRYSFAIPRLVEDIKSGNKLPRRFKQEPTYAIVYRDPCTLDARFLEVGEVSLGMLEKIKEKPGITYGELIKQICGQHQGNVQNILTGCLEAIEQFKELKLIVSETSAGQVPKPTEAKPTEAKTAEAKTKEAKTKEARKNLVKKSGRA